MTNRRRGICGLCYHSAGCGAIVHFDDDGKIDRLEPDPDVPLGSVLCPIADSANEIVYSDDRLLHPLRRNGPKGRQEFERISWDDAFEAIVESSQPPETLLEEIREAIHPDDAPESSSAEPASADAGDGDDAE